MGTFSNKPGGWWVDRWDARRPYTFLRPQGTFEGIMAEGPSVPVEWEMSLGPRAPPASYQSPRLVREVLPKVSQS